jgi:hypothetical protein
MIGTGIGPERIVAGGADEKDLLFLRIPGEALC